jgi:alpha-1,3-mannosyltransferase
MRVAHIVRQYLPSVGGMEEVVRNLAQHQQAHSRFEPYVVTLDRVFREPGKTLPANEKMGSIEVTRLPFTGSERYPLCPQVLNALKGADLVHVHGIDFFYDFLALTRPFHGRPMIASTHGGFFHTKFAKRLKRLYFNSVTRASALAYRRIIATSENDGDIFSGISGGERLKVIENGVDIQKFEGAASPTLQPTLIYFGRWSVNKGILEALDVLAALCLQQPDTPWQMTIAGREYDLNADLILAHAARLRIAARVSVVPGPSNDDLRALIAKASYFICMSHHEGFGIAPIEAMSAGLVPVLSAIPPFSRLVKSSGVGLILDAANPADQAQQIGQLHGQTLQARGLPGAGQREASRAAAQTYSWNRVASQYAHQYDQVIHA